MTVPKAIGVTSLIGGGVGSLDSEHVKDSNGNLAINDGDPALAFVQGDAVYNYIADADSGLAESSPDVIKPDWESVGVAYTGDLRWILHGGYMDEITLSPKASSTGAEGTIFYCKTDNQVYVGVE